MSPQRENNIGSHHDASPQRLAQRKRLFTIVVGLGLAAVIFGFIQLYNTITEPFIRLGVANTNEQDAAISQLRAQDTDGDGLNDYDEIFTHQTSIFVRDSDSDGRIDSEEIVAGSNPNCPEGQSCGFQANTNAGAVSATVLREALRKAGAPAYILDQTDDAALLQAYKDIVLGGQSNTNSVGPEDLGNLTASQIRSLLRSNGVDEQALNAVDDATLLQIYNDALTIES